MTKKTRYLLILTGFVCFIIFAPFIVLYVRGINFDLNKRAFVKTGILALKTEPKSTQVYLDGKLRNNSGKDIKFLTPKEYEIKISKEGFLAWVKRLPINPGEVTWATPVGDKLFLLKENAENSKLASNVTDFFRGKNSFMFLKEENLTITSLQNSNTDKNYSLPSPVDVIKTVSPDERFFLLTNSLPEKSDVLIVFDAANEKFWDISGLFAPDATFKFSPSSQLLALDENGLYETDFTIKSKNLILKGVKAFVFQDENFYYLTQNENGSDLLFSDSPTGSPTPLIKNLPDFKTAEIFINFKKQIMLLLDNKLYRVAMELQTVAEQLSQWNYESQESALIFFHSGQLDYFNPDDNNAQFITRSGQEMQNPILRLSVHYAFVLKDNQIVALELDTRDRQNTYTLYQSKGLKKFSVDSGAKHIFLLDGGELKSLTIR